MEQWVCSVCGYIHRGGSPPERCPSCGAPFTSFERRPTDLRERFQGLQVAEKRLPNFRYVIIGNSIAGRAAALAIESLHEDGEITVISEENAPLYNRPMLPDFIGGMEKARLFAVGELFPSSRQKLITGDAAVRIDLAAKTVVLASGSQIPYDALLLATGSAPIIVPWPGAEAEGIGYFRTLADAERLLAWAESAKRAVVVGGGLLGLEFVRAFHARGLQITHLIRGKHVGSPALDDQAAEVIERALQDWGVDLALMDEVERFESTDGRVCAALTKQGRRLPCELVGVAIGAAPRTELAKDAGLALDRGILVNARLETSAPGVYAAGDVAQAMDVIWGEPRVHTSWRNSREQGEFAGIFMAGGAGEFPGAVAANYQLAAGLPFCALGISNPTGAEAFQVEAAQHLEAKTYRKLVRRLVLRSEVANHSLLRRVANGALVGACLVGDLAESAELEQAIRLPSTAVLPRRTQIEIESGKAPAAPARRKTMRKMTEENLKAALASESQAHIRYMNFAVKAEKEGKPNVARLFRATTFAEQVHAGRHLKCLSGIGSTKENLAAAAEGENFEVQEMYPAYIAVANDQKEDDASIAFTHALKAEVQHREFYGRAQKAVDAGSDLSVEALCVCSYCGCTLEGEPPESCPVCGAPKKDFVKF